jgi:AraC-like DNA-binding protein
MFFYLISSGHFYCDSNYRVERSEYDSYLLMYVKEGEGTVWYNGKSYTARKNDVIFINCHRPHSYGTANGWETLWFHFDGNVSDEYYQLLYQKCGCVIPFGKSEIIPEYLEKLMDFFRAERIPNEPLISCYIQRILTELLLVSSDYNEKNQVSAGPVLSAIHFIHENYKNKIGLSDLSSKTNLSPFYFSKLFKKETGYSPYEYIIMIRINHAKTLLKTTVMKIKEIAFDTGFQSEANFVTCFKEHVGFTPSEFRTIPF